MTVILAIDTGGTFTDLAAYDRDTGRLVCTKSLTSYGNLADGVMACIGKAGLSLQHATSLVLGTTLVINTYVQRDGARTALVMTEGFRDVLEIGRGNRSVAFDLRYRPDPPLVPRDLRLTIRERIAADGQILQPLKEADLFALANALEHLNVDAVAISLINSFANDQHETQLAAFLRARFPGLFISAGTEITHEWYEFERTATAAANAYVGPKINAFIDGLSDRLQGDGYAGSFHVMASNGGLLSSARARQQPVMLLESGPVGGSIGTGVYARALGVENAIAFDMGGTTAKCAVLEQGRFAVRSPYYVGGYDRGFPIRSSVLDIVEIGAGGGSIAWVDPQGAFQVGPRSAGSMPGPICYGRGGQDFTVTDANLLLGRIDVGAFLSGSMALHVDAAMTAATVLAENLGFRGSDAADHLAQGVLTLAELKMAAALKQITVERGLDPRDFTLFAFGGGGPLHSVALARELGIKRLIIPPQPGNFSALGMLLADARLDESATFVAPLTADTISMISRTFERMEQRLTEAFAEDGLQSGIAFARVAEFSFPGQGHSIRVPVGGKPSLENVRAAFNIAYRRRYGHVDEKAPIMVTGLNAAAFTTMDVPSLDGLMPRDKRTRQRPGSRSVYFDGHGRLEASVLQRSALEAGYATHGPAVIEEYGSTTFVGPGDSFTIGHFGEIDITVAQS